MWLTSILENLKPDSQRSRPVWMRKRPLRKRPASRRLLLEALEDRCLLSYSIVDLGSLGVAAVNNAGQVAGTSGGHAVLWQDGVVTDLGTLGGASSAANDMNNSGQIVGYADTPAGIRHAFLVTPEDTNNDGQPDRWFRDNDLNGINDLLFDLGTLGGPASEARGINNFGKVVGRADMSTTAGSYRAFLWDSATGMQNLGTFGGNASEANAVNDNGQVVGTRYALLGGGPAQPHQAFRWDPASGGSLLGTLPFTPIFGNYAGQSKAMSINQDGQVVGMSGVIYGFATLSRFYYANDAFLWQNGAMTALHFSEHTTQTVDYDVSINNIGQVVGKDYLWQYGSRIALNSLPDPSLGWVISTTSDINDAAQIVGQGTLNGVTTSFLLSYITPPLPPSLSINDVSVSEGDTGTVDAVFTVTRSGPLDQTTSVSFATADGAAKAGKDYVATSGVLTFNPAETSKTVSVAVSGDLVDEYDETFFVNLSNPINGLITDNQALATILDNDPPPTLTINDVSRVEGNSGQTYLVFTVSLSAASEKTITVNYGTADGTAKVSDRDYVATSGTLTFLPGETTGPITVQVKGDKKKEADETFFLNLSGALNADLLDSQGLGTILNDD